jgi:hypothetical protein
MAFISNSISKDQIFIRVGEPALDTSGNQITGTLQADSQSQAVSGTSIFLDDGFENRLLVFDNGQTKIITNIKDVTTVDVTPNDRIPTGTAFTVYEASFTTNEKGQMSFGKAQVDPIMGDDVGIDLNYGRIRNTALPIHAHDVATKQYVDSLRIGNWNHIEKFEGDGVSKEFDVSVSISTYNAIVSVGGVIQDPFDSYIFINSKNKTTLEFFEPPPEETIITIRTTTSTNLSSSTALEELFVSFNQQKYFYLENEVFDKFGLMVTIDGVVQSTLNYDILTTPAGFRTEQQPDGTLSKIYYGNEYKILRFSEGLDNGAVVRVLNIRGRGFHSHSGTTLVLENDTLVPNTASIADGTYFDRIEDKIGAIETLVRSNFGEPTVDYSSHTDVFLKLEDNDYTMSVTHDMIANRGGLNLYANTDCDNLYINLPEMGGEYSPDQHMEVKIVTNPNTANVFINSHENNYMNYEGAFDDPSKDGGGVLYNIQSNVPTVVHLEWESYYRTWYIKYGVGLWNVDADPINYPDITP